MSCYKYSVSDCDLTNKSSLESYRKKRDEWLSFMVCDQPHAISTQLSTMLWDFGLFKVVNELRRLGLEQPKKDVGFNPYISDIFDAGFFVTQSLTIRRLTDQPSSRSDKNVISLSRLTSEIKAYRENTTREVYVCYDGLPFNCALEEKNWINKQIEVGTYNKPKFLPTRGKEAWLESEVLHKQFDSLSGVQPANRSRDDLIHPKWFDELEKQLTTCKDIRKFVDKFIAHAADPVSRKSLSDEQTYITLDKLREAHWTLFQVAAFINNRILGAASLAIVPIPQDDHLVNLDKKWIKTNKLAFAHKVWDDYLAECKHLEYLNSLVK